MTKKHLSLWIFLSVLMLCRPVQAKTLSDVIDIIDRPSYHMALFPLAKDGNYALVEYVGNKTEWPIVFKKVGNSWAEQVELKPEDTREEREYNSGQLQGVWAAYITNKGVHIFKRSGETWNEHQQITGDEIEGIDHFYIDRISMNGNRLAVAGAFNLTEDSPVRVVCMYKLEDDVWVPDGLLKNPVSTYWDYFVWDLYLSVCGDRVMVAERFPSSQTPVYIFRWNGNAWIEEAGLASTDTDYDDETIESVVLTNDAAHVLTEGRQRHQYHVQVFKEEGGNWVEQPILSYPGPEYTSLWPGEIFYYGTAMASDGNYLAVISVVREESITRITRAINIWLYRMENRSWTLMGGVDVPSSSCQYDSLCNYDPLIVIESGELLVSSRDGLYAYTIDPDEDLSDEGDLEGFDKAYYLEQKLAHQQSVSPEWAGRTTVEYEAYLKGEGYTAESHYSQWGYTEGLEPNAWFNHSEYVLALSRYLVQQGIYPSVQDAMAVVEASWPGDFYLHYLLWGYSIGINPSNSFDESLYLEDKLAFLQAGGTWSGRTVSDLKNYYNNIEMSVVEDYVLRGEGEGLIPRAVPEGERADICATDLPFDSVDSLRGFDKDWYLSAKLAHQQSVSPEWAGKTTEEYECYLRQAGYSAQSHYTRWGYLEGLSPNPYFDHSEYLEIISQRLVDLGVYTRVEDAEASVQAAWPGDLYQHYLAWGAGDGLDPSYSFDESRYLSDRLSLLQAGGEWMGKTVDDLRTYFTAQGTTALEDYLTNGDALGLTPTPVH